MQVAIAYDYLNQLGGGERVLKVITDLFPSAPIYTLFYDEQKTKKWFAGKQIYTSFLDKIDLVKNKHRLFIPLMPFAANSMSYDESYDLVFSLGAGWAHAIGGSLNSRCHIYYCFTPLRYAWHQEFLPPYLKPFPFLTYPLRAALRAWDKKMAQKPDAVYTISRYIAGKIQLFYQRPVHQILPPPLNDKLFYRQPELSVGDYFLAAGRLLHYKKFDLVIKAFNQLGYPLKIAGKGPEEKRLHLLANSNIEFLGYISDEELRHLYNQAQAFIFPQVEDFGLVAAEANACGCPVIAYSQGGALDIVIEGKNGVFFDEQTPQSLIQAVNKFYQVNWNREEISQTAKRFSVSQYCQKLLSLINYEDNGKR